MGRGTATPSSGILYGPSTPRLAARQQTRVEKRVEEQHRQTVREQEDELFEALLQHFEQGSGYPAPAMFVNSGFLHDPTSPTDKHYQGFIMVAPGARAEFVPLCKYGPGYRPHSQQSIETKGVGRDIDAALKAVNKKLAAKRKGRSGRSPYLSLDGSGPVEITRAYAAERAAEILGRPAPSTS